MVSERRFIEVGRAEDVDTGQGSPRNLGLAVAQTLSADRNPNCVWLAVSQLTEQ
jgi:hypothetical protein